jgi:quinoprotein glucose dehydrogenase
LFLEDTEPALVLEAARAINDEPITGATEELAALIDSPAMNRFLRGVPLVPPSVDKEASPGLGLEALLRRVLNANFHFGTQKTAQALAAFVARSEAPEKMRVEALTELADWEHPAGIDRVVGLWRPVAAVRSSQTAADALRPQLDAILHNSPQEVQVAALRCVERLQITSVGALLLQTLSDTKLPSEVRAQALRAIAGLNLPFPRLSKLWPWHAKTKMKICARSLLGWKPGFPVPTPCSASSPHSRAELLAKNKTPWRLWLHFP